MYDPHLFIEGTFESCGFPSVFGILVIATQSAGGDRQEHVVGWYERRLINQHQIRRGSFVQWVIQIRNATHQPGGKTCRETRIECVL